MKRRPPLRLSFDYMDTEERRVLSLEGDGILCMPVLGFDCYRRKWEEAPLHVHEECLEISLCLRGDLVMESDGRTYPFKAATGTPPSVWRGKIDHRRFFVGQCHVMNGDKK